MPPFTSALSNLWFPPAQLPKDKLPLHKVEILHCKVPLKHYLLPAYAAP